MFHSKYSNFRLLIAAVILHKLHIWDWGFILQSISQKHQKGQCLLISKMGNTNWTKIHCCRIVNASVAKTTLEDTFIIFGTQRSYYSIYWLHCKLNLLLILQGTTLGITRDFQSKFEIRFKRRNLMISKSSFVGSIKRKWIPWLIGNLIKRNL